MGVSIWIGSVEGDGEKLGAVSSNSVEISVAAGSTAFFLSAILFLGERGRRLGVGGVISGVGSVTGGVVSARGVGWESGLASSVFA